LGFSAWIAAALLWKCFRFFSAFFLLPADEILLAYGRPVEYEPMTSSHLSHFQVLTIRPVLDFPDNRASQKKHVFPQTAVGGRTRQT